MARSVPQTPFLSLIGISDRERCDPSRSKQMCYSWRRDTYTGINHDLLTLPCDFNSMADKGA